MVQRAIEGSRRGEDLAAALAREREELTFGSLAERYMERHARAHKRSAAEDERMLRDVPPRQEKMPDSRPEADRRKLARGVRLGLPTIATF
ncbi:MAG: hypothetical protein DMD81_15685 [Candidatus Rokuibacteriota bacterium]|nr:MAG: hypothetical protein DMD81_15685 [Candidatus Rokubacteria bacterium]